MAERRSEEKREGDLPVTRSASVEHSSLAKTRIVVLGQGSVGKTAIVRRFLEKRFVEQHRETVEDMHTRLYRINGVKMVVEIVDTAGNLSFPAMRRISMANASAFLLVYSLVDKDSFTALQSVIDEICEVRDRSELERTPILFAGNMADLVLEDEERREVSACMVTQWLIEQPAALRLTANYEVSAKTGSQVSQLFTQMLKCSGLLDKFQLQQQPQPVHNHEGSSPHSANSDSKVSTRRKFSFGQKLFSRSRSFVSGEEEEECWSTTSGTTGSGTSGSVAGKWSGRRRRQRARSTALNEETLADDCHVQ